MPKHRAMESWRLLVLAAFVVILRLPYFNSPASGLDDQFYLVVADKWINGGLLPYVDIWDRKPLGIFAIYAIALILFKNAILGYQILAALCVIATGAVIMRIGRMFSDGRIPFFAAMIYAAVVMLMDGAGGQSEIFYNLLVAMAAAIVFRLSAGDIPSRRRDIALWALASSLLFGLALQVKYICAVESAALSLYLLAALYRRGAFRPPGLAVLAGGMMFCGLLPTLVVGGAYAALGHWPAFYTANFESIFGKLLWHLSAKEFARRFVMSSLFGLFFLPFAAYGLRAVFVNERPPGETSALRAAVLWLLTAFAGALMLGNPSPHYFLPTLVPLSLLAGFGFLRLTARTDVIGRRLAALQGQLRGYGGLAALLAAPVAASFVVAHMDFLAKGAPTDVYAIGAYMKDHKTQECPFVFNRLPILYYLGDACAPSIYAFPNHLSEIAEVRSPDSGRLKELARVLAARPPMIFVQRPYTKDTDQEAIDMVERVLHNDYTLALQRPSHRQLYCVYRRKNPDGPPHINQETP